MEQHPEGISQSSPILVFCHKDHRHLSIGQPSLPGSPWLRPGRLYTGLQEHVLCFGQERPPEALIALQDRGMVAPVHKMSQCGQQIRQESTERTIAAIIRTPEPSWVDGEGRQSITVFVSELATVEGPRAIEVMLRHC